MIIQLSVLFLFVAFIILMSFWILKTEEKPKRKSHFLDPSRSYKMAAEKGLKLPSEYTDAIQESD